MSFEEPLTFADSQLIACAVYDHQGSYVGMVVKVHRDVNHQLFLVVQTSKSYPDLEKVRISGESVQSLDPERKKIYVDLINYPMNPVYVEDLPLWQERLVVNRTRRKVGTISIRKVVDVHTVEVPVRSERLLIEDTESGEILGDIGLTNTEVIQASLTDGFTDIAHAEDYRVKGHLTRFEDVINFLRAVSQYPNNSFVKGQAILTLSRIESSQSRQLPSESVETIHQTFESVDTTLQVLSAMASAMTNRCQEVFLDLLISDRNQAVIYQNWLARYRQPSLNSQARPRPTAARSLP